MSIRQWLADRRAKKEVERLHEIDAQIQSIRDNLMTYAYASSSEQFQALEVELEKLIAERDVLATSSTGVVDALEEKAIESASSRDTGFGRSFIDQAKEYIDDQIGQVRRDAYDRLNERWREGDWTGMQAWAADTRTRWGIISGEELRIAYMRQDEQRKAIDALSRSQPKPDLLETLLAEHAARSAGMEEHHGQGVPVDMIAELGYTDLED